MVLKRATVAALVAAGVWACAAGIEETAGRHSRLLQTSVRLHDHDLTIHLSAGYGAKSPLLLYATGDGGWIGGDVEVFNKLVPFGYPLAGFSAREYLGHLRNGLDQESPEDLADDYLAIAAAAAEALGDSPDTPIILLGKSRGAGLSVAAASVRALQPRLAGIVAIALTREEEYMSTLVGPNTTQHLPELQPYDTLPHLGEIPVAVIQSSADDYLPAGEAQLLFGPDNQARRFRQIIAADHNFDGAVAEMYVELGRSLQWVIDARRKDGAAASPAPSRSHSNTPVGARRGDR